MLKKAQSHLSRLRKQSFRKKVSILRSLDNAPSGAKLRQMYQYKVESYKEYERLTNEIKQEYRNGVVDPVHVGLLRFRKLK